MSRSNGGRQLEQGRAVGLGADPARMGRGDQVRPPLAGLAERDDRPCRDRLGAVHVGVDDVGADLGQVGRQGADRDRVVRVVDDEDRDAGALELADRAARRQRRRPTRRSGPGRSGSPARRDAPGRRRSCRSRGPRRRGSRRPPAAFGAFERGQARDPTAAVRSCQPFRRRTRRRWIGLVDRAPLVLVRLVAAQEVEPADAGREGALDHGVDHQDARRQVARVGVDARVVVEVAVGGLDVDPAAMRRPPTDRNARRSGPSAPWSSNSRRKKTRLCAPPGVSGKRPSSPHFFWCRSMNVSRSASGSCESSNRISPTASARRTLRRISWRSFLPSVAR